MALTMPDELRQDLRLDLGIKNPTDQAIFADAALDRLYTRANGDYAVTKVYARYQLFSQSAKFTQYTAGETAESRQQIWDHLKVLYELDCKEAGLGMGVIGVGLLDLNLDEPDPMTGL